MQIERVRILETFDQLASGSGSDRPASHATTLTSEPCQENPSEPAHWSSCSFSMPLDDSDTDGATPSTILVVEPDILVRMVIASYLRDCGYKVLEGVSAADVMTVLGSGQKVDLVFSEVRPQGRVNGFGLARLLRDQYPDVDVILTSGVTRAADKARKLCEEGPLEKPYEPQEVVRRINLLRERQRAVLKLEVKR